MQAEEADTKHQPDASAYNGLGSVYVARGDLDRAEQDSGASSSNRAAPS